MLQNRADPFGAIITTPARGAWMGNRGAIHNKNRRITRSYSVTRWITCSLEFKGRRREIMSPGKYTELFFLDEATAFAAGHRPCQECRRDASLEFKKRWAAGNPGYGFDVKTPVGDIDAIIHEERIAPDGQKRMHIERLETLPDGTFIADDKTAFLVKGEQLFPWNAEGYGPPIDRPKEKPVMVLTPASIVNAFRAGYTPQMAIPLTQQST